MKNALKDLIVRARELLLGKKRSKAVARDENEEADDSDADGDGDEQDHDGAPVEEFADVGFFDAGEAEEGVLAQADEGEDGVEAVLVGGEEVDADCKGEDFLRGWVLISMAGNQR